MPFECGRMTLNLQVAYLINFTKPTFLNVFNLYSATIEYARKSDDIFVLCK